MNEIITNEYDSQHRALDIVASDRSETNIIALESGIVTTVVSNIPTTNHNSQGLATYGNYVKIKQNNGKTALYAHMKYGSIQVKEGDYIEKGAIIGTIGDTGNAYGKHLHLEVISENNVKENPLISLNEKSSEETLDQSSEDEIKQNTNDSQEDEDLIQENSYSTTFSNTNSENTISNNNEEYLNAPNYKHGSIVDALKSVGIDSSYAHRKQLAEENGISNYHGSYNQNIKLLNLLKNGKLKNI